MLPLQKSLLSIYSYNIGRGVLPIEFGNDDVIDWRITDLSMTYQNTCRPSEWERLEQRNVWMMYRKIFHVTGNTQGYHLLIHLSGRLNWNVIAILQIAT